MYVLTRTSMRDHAGFFVSNIYPFVIFTIKDKDFLTMTA